MNELLRMKCDKTLYSPNINNSQAAICKKPKYCLVFSCYTVIFGQVLQIERLFSRRAKLGKYLRQVRRSIGSVLKEKSKEIRQHHCFENLKSLEPCRWRSKIQKSFVSKCTFGNYKCVCLQKKSSIDGSDANVSKFQNTLCFKQFKPNSRKPILIKNWSQKLIIE